MPHLHAPRHRLARRALGALGALLTTVCLAMAPAAHAGFTVSATLGPLSFAAIDADGNPLPPGSYSFNGDTDVLLLAGGATTTLPSANLWANYSSAQVMAGAGPQLMPIDYAAHITGGLADLGYSAAVTEQGMQITVSGSGANRAATAVARAGATQQGAGLLTLAPFATLRLDVPLSYQLGQDGQCDGDVCDAAFVTAAVITFDGDPGTATGGGPSVGFGLGPRPVVNAGYAWFLTDSQALSASGTLMLTSYFVNDTDQPRTMDFYISLTGAGSSVAAVPEPGSAAMLTAGVLAVLGLARRRRGTQA